MLTQDLQYAGKHAIAELLCLCEGESKMLASLRRRLKEKIDEFEYDSNSE